MKLSAKTPTLLSVTSNYGNLSDEDTEAIRNIILLMRYISFLIILLLSCFPLSAAPSDLSPRYKEWLELVKPIITSTERDVFLRLQTDEARDKFIVFFWKQRDPLPDTEANEFYEEYMKRVSQADSLFGPGSGKRGSLTERGYYYLLLGPPLERHLFTTHSELWPLELWFYQGDERFGLPPFFYLIFYQPQGQGDYRLFYPGLEGPEQLLIPSLYRQATNREAAYNVLKKISSELASASLSLIPGEKLPTATALSSQTVLASIRSLPEKKFNDAYARNYLHYQGLVEVDYADRFVESHLRTRVFLHQGQPFVHWALEPVKMSFSPSEGGQVYASYELYIKIEDQSGRTIGERSEEVPVRLSREEFEAQGKRIFSFQDLFPIIPGKFKLHFLLKNKTAREFSSLSSEVEIPLPGAKISLGQPIIYLEKEKRPENQVTRLQAFCLGQWRYLVNARAEIPLNAPVGLLLQSFLPAGGNLGPGGWLKIELNRADTQELVKTIEKELSSAIQAENILDTGLFSLSDLKPGYYYLSVRLLNSERQVLAAAQENFILLGQSYPAIPRILSRLHPSFPSLENLKALGTQFFLSGQYEAALKVGTEILRLKDEPETRLFLAKSLFALNRFEESLSLLLPIYEISKSREMAKVIALNLVSLKKWSEALPYLESLLQEITELSVLNLTAECYLHLGLPQKALPLLRKSLELDPEQPQVKKMEEEARSRIK